MMRFILLTVFIVAYTTALELSLEQSIGDESGLVNVWAETLGRYDLAKFDYDGGEKVRTVVEMANILCEEKNLFDAYSALQAGRGKSLLLGSEFMEVQTMLGKTYEEKCKAENEYYASHGQYPTALFGETLFANFQGEKFEDVVIRSGIQSIELNKLPYDEKEVVVYCTNGYVQFLIARDEHDSERLLYKEARVVKYESKEGLVVRFKRGRLERAASCVYPVAPTGRVRYGSVETAGDSENVIVDYTLAPETIFGQVAIFEGQKVRVVPLETPVPYSEFDYCN